MGLSLVLFCGVIAGISGFLFGYDSGVMTTTIAQEQFLQQFNPTSSMMGTIIAIMQAGGFFGCLVAGKLSDLWGRKKSIMFGCVFVVVSL
jgi:MFS family permease